MSCSGSTPKKEWNRPVYGWAMNFGTGYQKQRDIVGTSCRKTTRPPCYNPQTDGKYTCQPPFYQLGPHWPPVNCPYYNYTLPDTYPEVESPTINPRMYWFLPYDEFDQIRYDSSSIVQVPKPG